MAHTHWYEKWFSSPYYDILYKHRNHEEAQQIIAHLYHRLAMQPNEKVLDIACGDGRHAIQLHKKGLNVTGIDLSERKITQAKQWARHHLRFFVHDMRQAFAHNEYHYVTNFFTSFGYAENPQDNLHILHAMAQALLPQGKLVIDYLNPEQVKQHLIPNQTLTREGIQFTLRRSIDDNCVVKHIEVKHQHQTHHFTEKVRLLTQNTFIQYFEQTKLKHLCTFGDYQLRSYDPHTSERMILLAQKHH